MPMMMMTTRSSIRVKPWSFSSIDLRIRASMLFSLSGTMSELLRRFPPGGPKGPDRGSWADLHVPQVPWLCVPASRRGCPFWPSQLDDTVHVVRTAPRLEPTEPAAHANHPLGPDETAAPHGGPPSR